MDALSSFGTVVMVLAAIFLPQVMLLVLSGWRGEKREEYLPDGR